MTTIFVVFCNDYPEEAYLDERKAECRVQELKGDAPTGIYWHLHEVELKDWPLIEADYGELELRTIAATREKS